MLDDDRKKQKEKEIFMNVERLVNEGQKLYEEKKKFLESMKKNWSEMSGLNETQHEKILKMKIQLHIDKMMVEHVAFVEQLVRIEKQIEDDLQNLIVTADDDISIQIIEAFGKWQKIKKMIQKVSDYSHHTN